MMRRPSRLVLLGHPVHHSLSPTFQNAALRSAGIPLTYEALDVAPRALMATLERLASEEAAGNVTIPHKEQVAARCVRLSSLARRVGAVNTFWFDDGELVGDNTDVAGFDAAVGAAIGAAPRDCTIALLGAGGGAAAVLAAAEGWSGVEVRLWNRHAARAQAMAARFNAIARVAPTLHDALHEASVVVNATPIGMSGDEQPVPVARLSTRTTVVDLVYRRGGTPWVRAARQRGLVAMDGLPMLIEQGALAFERWFGVACDRKAMWASVA